MNWITNYVRPKINSLLQRKQMPENLWVKCPQTGEMVFHTDLEANMGVIPGSGYHMRITAQERLAYFFDDGEYEPIDQPPVATDPLKFRDKTKYADKLKEHRRATEMDDSVLAGRGKSNGIEMVAVVHDMRFIGGSLGMGAGEMIVKAMGIATADKLPLALFAASGGARMQEGILSLMQMPRTTVAVELLKEAGCPYIVVLTNPTTGGVSASYAMLGDVHIAEPGAVIGFAGRRVIEQTIREKLPDDFQTAEYLREHGMVDMVVKRQDLKSTITRLVALLTKRAVEPILLSYEDSGSTEAAPPAESAENAADRIEAAAE
jgi:acetyl-CoA carboxylase carboxyl transferase subunit beta